MSRGFFEIGIYRGKTVANVGTLWRSAYQMGAAGIFTVGRRYPSQASDTLKTYRHIPCREFLTFHDLLSGLPLGSPIVAIEMGGKAITDFNHPASAIYLLGAEDHGIPPAVLERCHHIISLPSVRTNSYNVAVAGSLVMYDRNNKLNGWSP